MLKTAAGSLAPAVGDLAAVPTRRLAEAVWSEMQWRNVLPTPRNFALWFTYRAEADACLTKRMAELLAQGRSLSAATLDSLYNDHVASPPGAVGDHLDAGGQAAPDRQAAGRGAANARAEPTGQQVSESAAQIEDAARTLVDQIAGSQVAAAGYGHELARWNLALGGPCSQEALLLAVAKLAAETGFAAERNRLLQEQLATSAARIGRLRHSLTAVRHEATTDALTGIANRKAFEARVQRLLRQSRTAPQDVVVLLIDIDHFKAFNDAYGHRTGDLVLRLVARVLADSVKGRDCAARYGGEEFAVMLAGTDLSNGAAVARQISASLSRMHLIENTNQGPCTITVSVGVAQHRPGESVAEMVERADRALYEAKRLGRNQVCVEQPSDDGTA